uniref:Uncharacterized protein n=1 Tax=Clastoptera arizonana TaxID=38151 RepID=A0A1B6CKH5_9HEMI
MMHIEQLPVDRTNRPLQDVKVINCGQLVLKSKIKEKKSKRKHRDDSSDDSGSSEPEKKKKKHKKSEKKKDKKKKDEKRDKSRKSESDETSEEGEVSDGEQHPLVTVTNIQPDEIPEIPPNRFLYRADKSSNKEKDRNREKERVAREKKRKARIRGVTKSGRVIKGRGVFVSIVKLVRIQNIKTSKTTMVINIP